MDNVFTLMLADACTAAYKKCETKYFTKMFIKKKCHQKTTKLPHSCTAEFKFCTLLLKQQITLNTKSF